MQLYAGLDLHARSTYIGILDQQFNRVFRKRVANKVEPILQTPHPFRDQLKGLVVESTYNWYWLIDGLKDRPVRDLSRKRLFLVRQKTAHIISLQSLLQRCCAQRLSANEIRKLTVAEQQLLEEEHVFLSAQANLDTIAFLTRQIQRLEKTITKKVKLHKAFDLLMTVPGIGKILAMTIMLEVGDIGRFPKIGNFASYCRCVSSQRLSDGKSKGHGNRKNGSRYLSWAFVEAAHTSRRYSQRFRSYYNRKAAQTNTSVATKALSNKLARICYYIMRDQRPFREDLLSH